MSAEAAKQPVPRVPLTRQRIERVREMIVDELEAAWLYDRMAEATGDARLIAALKEMAASERDHAAHWCDLIGDRSLLEHPPAPSLRRRLLAWHARHRGFDFVVDQLRKEELIDIRRYQSDPDSGTLAQEEREHRATLAAIEAGDAPAELSRSGASSAGTFRAALFGLNDGVVSNLALVAGVAGVAADSNAILVAGIGGWLAGAFSMAAGEYVSVRSQTELEEQQLAHEADELELDPDEEQRELVAIYRSKGLSPALAEQVAAELMQNPTQALHTMAREELGFDPQDLGSPVAAAAGSFLSFSAGALVPILPYIAAALGGWTVGYVELAAAIAIGATVLAVAGLLSSVVTSRHPLYASARSVAIGLLATAATFGIGRLLPLDL